MEDEQDHAKLIEILENLSQKYAVVNVRLDQHDKLLLQIEALTKKFNDLENHLLNKHQKEHEARLNILKDVDSFRETLKTFKKVNDDLSVKVVEFEGKLKNSFIDFINNDERLDQLFLKLEKQLKDLQDKKASKEELEKMHTSLRDENQRLLDNLKAYKRSLEKISHQLVPITESLSQIEGMQSFLKKELENESHERREAYSLAMSKWNDFHPKIEKKHAALIAMFKEEVEKAKKEMVLSPESYNSLQKQMSKEIEILSLDASNSVLKASVCESQLKVLQRHIDAINQKIKLLELEK